LPPFPGKSEIISAAGNNRTVFVAPVYNISLSGGVIDVAVTEECVALNLQSAIPYIATLKLSPRLTASNHCSASRTRSHSHP